MALAQNEMCLADAVEDWWDNNIEKIKKKIELDRWINEFENTAHGNSDYLQKAVSNALATKKYDWDTYDIINQSTQDDIAEVLANLAYQDLVNDDEWRTTRWDSFEESYNGDKMDRKKLESRIARLEKLLSRKSVKNEGMSELRQAQTAFEQIKEILDSVDESVDNQDSRLQKVMYKLRSESELGLRLIRLLLSQEMANTDNF